MKIGGDGDLEHMQKCLGELLDEENEHRSISNTMADKNISSDAPLAKAVEPVSNDLGKLIYYSFFIYLQMLAIYFSLTILHNFS